MFKNSETKDKKKINFDFILKFFVFPIFVILIFVSTVFGMFKIIDNGTIKQDEELENRYQIQVHVENLSNDYDINYVANYYDTQLNNLGLNSSKVGVLDNNDLIIEFPISTIKNNKDDKFSLETQDEFLKELITIEGTLLNTANVEFRSYTGDLLFDYDDENKEVIFIPPATSTDTSSTTYNLGDINEAYDTYDISLIDSANVEFINGDPYIEIHPKEKYIAIFNDGVNQMAALYDESTNPYGNFYTLWFNYDLYDFLASTFDSGAYSSANANSDEEQVKADPLLQYVYYDEVTGQIKNEPRKTSKPFYITSGRIEQTHSNYDDSYAIYGNFSLNEANAIANKINFSIHNFDISVIDQHFILNSNDINNYLVLIIFFSLLFLIILIVSFSFVWWFGLLGAIVVLSSIIPGIIIVTLISLFVIPVGWILFSGLTIAYFIVAILQYNILKIYKKNTSKNTSTLNKFKKNTKDFSGNTIIYIFVLLFTIAIASFLFTTQIQYYVLFTIVMIVIFYAFAYILWIPLLTFIDYLSKYSFRYTNDSENWKLLIGKDSKIFNEFTDNNILKKFDNKTKKSNKILLISFFVIAILGFSALILEKTSDNGINKVFLNDKYYQYNVIRTIPLTMDDAYGDNKNDRYDQKELINEVERNEDKIINVFNDNGIDVESTQIIKKENYQILDNSSPDFPTPTNYEFYYEFSYGLSVYSKDKMDSETYISINNDLKEIVDQSSVSYKVTDDIDSQPITDYSFHFVLIPTGSITGTYNFLAYSENYNETYNDISIVQNYNFNDNILRISMGILLFLILIFIMLLISKRWAITFSIMLTLILEVLLTTLILFIFYIPISMALFIAIITSISISVFAKLKMLKKDENEKTTIIFSKTIIPNALLSIIILLNLFAAFFFGISIAVSFVYFIIFSIIYTITNIYIYPKLTSSLIKKRSKNIEYLKLKDEEYVKEHKNVSEEYIKGINK
ncbi:MAG: hypothetical protein HPAVJP_2300 [Candidatus Hepatoplasma vulgare]|nr:MAG: hypothetical protein HPAVJP_2300 [Candidatus Hepatoplasma sp.]